MAKVTLLCEMNKMSVDSTDVQIQQPITLDNYDDQQMSQLIVF